HPHLSTGGEHVDRPVVVPREVHAEGCGWLAELLDLLAEGLDLVALGLQRGRDLLVLRKGPGEIALRLEELLLEDLHLAWGVPEPAAKQRDLVLKELHLGLKLVHLLFVELLLFAWIQRPGHPSPPA